MKIVIYTKSNCPNCVTAKQLLKSKDLSFEEPDIDDEGERMAFSMVYPDNWAMPQIFIDGQCVGGLTGLQVALKQVGK